MLTTFSVSFFSVLRVFIVCLCGAWMVRLGVFTPDFRQRLGRTVLYLMLPCLLFSKLSVSASVGNLRLWAAIPLTALLYICCGLLLGAVAMLVSGAPREHRRILLSATTFGNSGYIPFPLVLALAATAPLFQGDPQAGTRGVAYVSVYLVCMSPCMWGIGYPFLAHRPIRDLRWNQLLSPPVLSCFVGIAVGVIPALRSLLVANDAPLRIVLDTAELIGQAAIPCALFIVGANLAEIRGKRQGAPTPLVLSVVWVRMLLLPAVGILVTVTLWRLRWIPHDPMCALVLMLEASVPTATNLVVMCQVHGRGEREMSHLLLITYLAAVPILTVWVALYLWIIGNL